MKIKKKNTTIPINGKIVDTENVEDKTSNAPSMRLVEEMIKEKYSTDEQVIGTWVDGKPLYRKVVTYTATSTIGNTSETTNISINHNISNLNSIIRTQISDSVDGIYPIANGGSTANVNYYTSSVLNFRLVNITLTARTFYIILEYTKTTD